MSGSRNLQTGLAKYLKKKAKEGPMPGVDYYERFERIDQYLNEHVHPNVNEGAAVEAQLRHDPASWLTDHGPKHVHTVIQRASALVRATERKPTISPYEAYLLLLAIHFHDVGNIFGREEHEKKIWDVIRHEMGDALLGQDTIEKRMIVHVAMAHGGHIDGDKDTIDRALREYDRSPHVRLHMLAAVLRLADELADDYTRANRFGLSTERGREMIRGSEVYHMYADRLHKVEIRMEEAAVKLTFMLTPDHLVTLYRKGENQVLLFDEIQDRLLKLHREAVYCRRYLLPDVHIDRIEAVIGIYSAGFGPLLHQERLTLQETGYPIHPTSLESICREIKTSEGMLKTGEWLRDLIMNKGKPGEHQ
jgi:hypothetical protein